jgi:hypothetical protein
MIGPRLTARDRRIDKAEPACLGGLIKLGRDLGRDRGVIDKDRARAHARERPVGAKADAAQIVIIADAGHHERGPLCGLARRRGVPSAMLGRPFFGLGRRAVIDADIMPRRRQVARHGIAHHTQSQKCQFCHVVFLLLRCRCLGRDF